MIDWYLKVVRDNYANFSGRARRSEYWYYVLCGTIISIVLSVIDLLTGYGFLGNIYSLVVFIPGLAVSIRRLHDIGKSGWYLLVLMIPFFVGALWLALLFVSALESGKFTPLVIGPVLLFLGGTIWMLVLFCKEGDSGSNAYGDDPKKTQNPLDEIGTTEIY